MMTSNITNTDALRDELINGYFRKTLLKSYTPSSTIVTPSLISDIINKKAKRVAFRIFGLPFCLYVSSGLAISNLCSEIFNFYYGPCFGSQSDFDEWFFVTAEKFIVDCKPATVTFGNAQKIINITLKHLYAYADKSKISHFKYCHFTLDDITYGGFYKKHLKHDTSFYKKEVNIGGKTKKWTHLSDHEYKKIQDEIREYFGSATRCSYKDACGNNLTPFEAEFVVWSEYKK